MSYSGPRASLFADAAVVHQSPLFSKEGVQHAGSGASDPVESVSSAPAPNGAPGGGEAQARAAGADDARAQASASGTNGAGHTSPAAFEPAHAGSSVNNRVEVELAPVTAAGVNGFAARGPDAHTGSTQGDAKSSRARARPGRRSSATARPTARAGVRAGMARTGQRGARARAGAAKAKARATGKRVSLIPSMFRRTPTVDTHVTRADNPAFHRAASMRPKEGMTPTSHEDGSVDDGFMSPRSEEVAAAVSARQRQLALKVLNIWRFARKSRKAILRQRMQADADVARHNMYMFWTAFVSIVLMIIDEEWRWEYGPEFLYGVNDSMDGTSEWMITDFLIPACNMVLVWRLVEHYKELSTAKMRLWLLRTRWEGFTTSTLKWKFIVELVICVIQPVPIRNLGFAGKSWLRHFGLLMFLRVYIAARLLRDKSTIYRNRHRAKDLGLRIHVGFMSSLRAELRRRPLFWMVWSIFGTIIVFTYVIFVMERYARFQGHEGNILTWNDSLWFVVATLTTVGYGDVTPSNSKIYYPAIAEGFVSLVLTSVFISVVIDKLSMSTPERKLFRMISRQGVDKRYEKRAQVLVNMWLIHIIQRRRQLAKYARRGRVPPASAASIWSKLKPFVKDCRQARHERTKLGSTDHETDPVELLLGLTKQMNRLQHDVMDLKRTMDDANFGAGSRRSGSRRVTGTLRPATSGSVRVRSMATSSTADRLRQLGSLKRPHSKSASGRW